MYKVVVSSTKIITKYDILGVHCIYPYTVYRPIMYNPIAVLSLYLRYLCLIAM